MLNVARHAVEVLSGLEGRLRHETAMHAQHLDYARRSRELARHLDAIITLVASDTYASALAILRTCLEHHLVDHLMFLGWRYVTVIESMPEEEWEQLLSDYEAGAERMAGLQEPPVRSRRGNVRIVREATVEGSETTPGYKISPLYFLARKYSPFAGRPTDQDFLDDGLIDVDRQREQAHRHRNLYEKHLSWQSITESLGANGFYNHVQLQQLQVHYRFLSAYTHALQAGYDLLHPRRRSTTDGYDHYSSEIVLLYVNAIAAREIEAFLNMAEHPPVVEVAQVDEAHTAARRSRRLSAHLWFPGDLPHAYDRFIAANRAVWRHYREHRSLPDARAATPSPSALAEEDVDYYANPLTRLIGMHQSQHEMTTGNVYRSPWERPDANMRL